MSTVDTTFHVPTVKIRQLEWEQDGDGFIESHLTSRYAIKRVPLRDESGYTYVVTYHGTNISFCDTAEAAKEAAQQDHVKRILFDLIPAIEPISTAPRDGSIIIGWSPFEGWRETFYNEFHDPKSNNLKGVWYWSEPQNNWIGNWKPEFWMPAPEMP